MIYYGTTIEGNDRRKMKKLQCVRVFIGFRLLFTIYYEENDQEFVISFFLFLFFPFFFEVNIKRKEKGKRKKRSCVSVLFINDLRNSLVSFSPLNNNNNNNNHNKIMIIILKNFLITLLSFVTILNADSSKNLIETINDQPNLKTLSFLISRAPPSYTSLLTDEKSNFTIFVPNDEAIHKVELELLQAIDNLDEIVRYHIVPGSYPNSSLESTNYLSTYLLSAQLGRRPQVLVISQNNDKINIDYGIRSKIDAPATIVNANIEASNGYIHIIDKGKQVLL